MKKVKITDLCLNSFWIMPQTPKYIDKGIPYITSKNIKNGCVNFDRISYISEDDYNKISKNREIIENDFLISMIGTIGEVAIVKKSDLSFYGQNMYLLRFDKNKVNYKFMYYFLTSPNTKNILLQNKNNSTQGYIKYKTITNLDVNIYDIKKQDEIVAKLDKLCDILAFQEKKLEKLDLLVKSQFIEMFGTLQDSKYNVKTIEDLCEFVKDGTHQTPIYTDDKINGFKFLSSKDVTSGYINWDNIKYIPEHLHNELYARIKPQRNDILLAKNGTTGISAIVETDDVFDIYVSLALLRFHPENNIKYLWIALNMPDTKKQFNDSLKGVGVPNLHLGEIKKTKLLIPPIELQNQFADFVKHIDKLKFSTKKSIEKLEICYKSLMQEYFG